MLEQLFVKAELEAIMLKLNSMESKEDKEYKELVSRLAELVKIELDLAKLEENEEESEESVLWKVLNNGPLVTALGSGIVAMSIIGAELFGSAIMNSRAMSFVRFK